MYYDFLDTCQSVEWELLSEWSKVHPKPEDEDGFRAFDEKLILRQSLHTQVDNPVRDGRGRSASLAVITLVAFLDETDYYLWVKPRSWRVAISPNTFAVIPSGTFQPASIEIEEEWRQGGPLATLYREYLEELFSRPEPTPNQPDWKYIYGDPCLRYLQQLLEDGQADLFFTGVAVNLPSLQPEICTLLVVKTPEWYKFHTEHPSEDLRFSFNEEWANLIDIRNVEDLHKFIARIPYSHSDEELMKSGRLYSPNIVPTSAAAFWLGIDVLREEVLEE